jgi:hypothetical protein
LKSPNTGTTAIWERKTRVENKKADYFGPSLSFFHVSRLNEHSRRHFGLVRRGVFGTYHHSGRGYMRQYLNEFDFSYNNRKVKDSERTMMMLKATEGKRLTLNQEAFRPRFWKISSTGRLKLLSGADS